MMKSIESKLATQQEEIRDLQQSYDVYERKVALLSPVVAAHNAVLVGQLPAVILRSLAKHFDVVDFDITNATVPHLIASAATR